MICPLKNCECINPPEATVYTEFAGQFAYVRCRQTGELFIVMTAVAHQVLMAKVAELEHIRARTLVDRNVRYETKDAGALGENT